MKRRFTFLFTVVLLAAATWGQAPPAASPQAAKPAAAAGNLESVLSKMDAAAASFKTLDASFIWDQYSKIVDEHTIDKGTIYFRRTPKGIDMAANIPQPENERKYLLFTDSKLQVYQPKIDQVTEYDTGKNREAVESFLVLGFGGRGHDLSKSFEVKYAGTENVSGINTAKLELTPKSQRVRGMFSLIILWIDPARGIAVQQQLITPEGGDYRLAKYSDIKINQPIPNDVFKLKTTGSTKTVRPQT